MTVPQRAPGGFPVVGIIGGGQLARMCQPPAVGLAVTLSVLSETADSSAALVVPCAPVGDYTDVETVREWARSCDVVTFDHEHVPTHHLHALEASGVTVRPRSAASRSVRPVHAISGSVKTTAGIAWPSKVAG